MDLSPYIEGMRRDLIAAAEAAGPDASAVAERLGFAVDAAARLALMEAISNAAAEISAQLPNGSVDVRLAGRDLEFAVQGVPSVASATAAADHIDLTKEEEEGGGSARVTVRMPESVKTKAEARADAANQSLNTWIVNAIRVSAMRDGIGLDPSELINHFLGQDPFGGRRGPRHMKGWN
ncbi:toxin-antitoxin system HicB family antitoxin [Calidifontibacter terrae]